MASHGVFNALGPVVKFYEDRLGLRAFANLDGNDFRLVGNIEDASI